MTAWRPDEWVLGLSRGAWVAGIVPSSTPKAGAMLARNPQITFRWAGAFAWLVDHDELDSS